MDSDSGLYYYGARYYNPALGRFVSEDPASLAAGDKKVVEKKIKNHFETFLANPQTMNSYSYAANNPLKYIDAKGEYIETALDLIFFTLSARDFYLDPNLTTGAWAVLDGIGVALPIPAAAGYIKNGVRAGKILKYFDKVATRTGKGVIEIGKTFSKYAFFKQNKLKWSAGEAGDSLANLIGHFELHGSELGAKSLDEYYKKANDFIGNFVESTDVKKITQNGDTVYQNNKTGERAITNENGSIKSYYNINSPKK